MTGNPHYPRNEMVDMLKYVSKNSDKYRYLVENGYLMSQEIVSQKIIINKLQSLF